MKTLVSYELYCNLSDAGGRINKPKDKNGDGFKLVLKQTREVGK